MQFGSRAKRIVWIVGSIAVMLLAVLLCVFLKYGKKKTEEPLDFNMLALKEIQLKPFDDTDPVLDSKRMEEFDFTVLEIWYPQSADCVRYMSEMNMFAEECLHRDDEMYANVVGVCIKCSDKSGKTDEAAVKKAAEIARGEDVLYHQYVADAATEKELEKLTSKIYPTVIFLNRRGEIIRIVSGKNGKELCDCLDELIDLTMKEKKAKEKEKRKKE